MRYPCLLITHFVLLLLLSLVHTACYSGQKLTSIIIDKSSYLFMCHLRGLSKIDDTTKYTSTEKLSEPVFMDHPLQDLTYNL